MNFDFVKIQFPVPVTFTMEPFKDNPNDAQVRAQQREAAKRKPYNIGQNRLDEINRIQARVKKRVRRADHKLLDELGVPRFVDGSKLGLKKRKMIYEKMITLPMAS